MIIYLKRLKSSKFVRVKGFPMYGGIGVSAPSLHRESLLERLGSADWSDKAHPSLQSRIYYTSIQRKNAFLLKEGNLSTMDKNNALSQCVCYLKGQEPEWSNPKRSVGKMKWVYPSEKHEI